MKYRSLTALIAVIFMFFVIVPVAYAEPLDDDPPEIPVETTPTPETPTPEPLAPNIPIPTPEPLSPNPFTPCGTGTVMNYVESEAGKVFYTQCRQLKERQKIAQSIALKFV